MTTHNTREGIEEILKQLDSLMRQAVEWQDTGAVYAYEKAKDVVRSVETTFHQELQKAREEVVREFATDLCRVCTKRWPEYGQALPLYSEDVVAIASRYLDQSELDQPTCNRIGGHLGEHCCCHTKSCDLDLYPTNITSE